MLFIKKVSNQIRQFCAVFFFAGSHWQQAWLHIVLSLSFLLSIWFLFRCCPCTHYSYGGAPSTPYMCWQCLRTSNSHFMMNAFALHAYLLRMLYDEMEFSVCDHDQSVWATSSFMANEVRQQPLQRPDNSDDAVRRMNHLHQTNPRRWKFILCVPKIFSLVFCFVYVIRFRLDGSFVRFLLWHRRMN